MKRRRTGSGKTRRRGSCFEVSENDTKNDCGKNNEHFLLKTYNKIQQCAFSEYTN